MKHGRTFKSLTCFVCVSFLLFTGGVASLHAEGKRGTLPVGEMISRGIVKFQVGENLWKQVEASSFPIFQGMTIKTEKGTAIVSLTDQNQIELGPDSVLYFEEKDQIRLSKGSMNFRISPSRVLRLCAGNFIVAGTSALHASRGLASLPRADEAAGSLSIHSNSAVTVQGMQGHLTLLNQERTVLATIASKESLTLPAAIGAKAGKGKTPPVQIAQVGEEDETLAGKGKEAPPEAPQKTGGLSGTTWLGIGAGVLVLGGIAALAGGGGGGGGESSSAPVCP